MPRCQHMIHVNQQFHSEMQRMQKLQRHFTKQRKLYILPWLGCSRMSQMKHHLRVSSKVNMMGKQCFLWMSRKRRLGPTRGNNCLPQIFPTCTMNHMNQVMNQTKVMTVHSFSKMRTTKTRAAVSRTMILDTQPIVMTPHHLRSRPWI